MDSQGRAVINGLQGPESVLFDISFRYQLPLGKGFDSLDFFYDIFNLFNRTNYVAPTGLARPGCSWCRRRRSSRARCSSAFA